MNNQGRTRAYNWLMSQTEPLQPSLPIHSGVAYAFDKPILVGILAQVLVLIFANLQNC